MRLPKLPAFLCAGAFCASITVAEQDLRDVDHLTDGIRAFICNVEELGSIVPMVFVQEQNQWRLSGSNYDQVSKVGNGFRLKNSNNENSLGYLLQEADWWKLYFLDETGQSSSKCASMDTLTDSIVSAIAPKLLENANALITSNAEALSEIEKITAINHELRENLASLEQTVQELLPTLTARTMYELGAYSEEFGYEITSVDAADFSWDFDVNGVQICVMRLERNSIPLRDECLQKLEKALLPNPER